VLISRDWMRQDQYSRPAVLAAAMMLASAVLLFSFWNSKQPVASLQAAEFLAQVAEAEQHQHLGAGGQFARQHIQIRANGERVEWTIYHTGSVAHLEPSSTRMPRSHQLESMLHEAGISEADPLSAASFKDWHDSLRSPSDNVRQSSSGVVTISTALSAGDAGSVQTQTLTVRSRDYHPTVRTVVYRNNQTIEIAELDYDVLPSGIAPVTTLASSASAPHPGPAALQPATLSEGQLDLAELDARLALNRIHADVGEQIELARNPGGVLITGLVDSEERKRQIVNALTMIAHVRTQVETVDSFKFKAATSSVAPHQDVEAPRLHVVNTVSQPSPLLLLSQRMHWPSAVSARIADRLLEASQRISQHSHALRQLEQGCAASRALDAHGRADCDELMASHRAQLRDAVAGLDTILRMHEISFASPTSADGSERSGAGDASQDIVDASLRTFALVRELTSGSGENQREAISIIADLRQRSCMLSNMLRLAAAGR
jgi:hypothetical protein